MSRLFLQVITTITQTFLNHLKGLPDAEQAVLSADRLMAALNAGGIPTVAQYTVRTGIRLVSTVSAADLGACEATLLDEARALGLSLAPLGRHTVLIHPAGKAGPVRIRLVWSLTE